MEIIVAVFDRLFMVVIRDLDDVNLKGKIDSFCLLSNKESFGFCCRIKLGCFCFLVVVFDIGWGVGFGLVIFTVLVLDLVGIWDKFVVLFYFEEEKVIIIVCYF